MSIQLEKTACAWPYVSRFAWSWLGQMFVPFAAAIFVRMVLLNFSGPLWLPQATPYIVVIGAASGVAAFPISCVAVRQRSGRALVFLTGIMTNVCVDVLALLIWSALVDPNLARISVGVADAFGLIGLMLHAACAALIGVALLVTMARLRRPAFAAAATRPTAAITVHRWEKAALSVVSILLLCTAAYIVNVHARLRRAGERADADALIRAATALGAQQDWRDVNRTLRCVTFAPGRDRASIEMDLAAAFAPMRMSSGDIPGGRFYEPNPLQAVRDSSEEAYLVDYGGGDTVAAAFVRTRPPTLTAESMYHIGRPLAAGETWAPVACPE